MIIPTATANETAITVVFWKPIQEWTEDDREQILKRLREFMCKHTTNSRKRRSARRPAKGRGGKGD